MKKSLVAIPLIAFLLAPLSPASAWVLVGYSEGSTFFNVVRVEDGILRIHRSAVFSGSQTRERRTWFSRPECLTAITVTSSPKTCAALTRYSFADNGFCEVIEEPGDPLIRLSIPELDQPFMVSDHPSDMEATIHPFIADDELAHVEIIDIRTPCAKTDE